MSYTFTLVGNTSELSATYYPDIKLDAKYTHSLGLIGFHAFNSIPNIQKDVNDTFSYTDKGIAGDDDGYLHVQHNFQIPEGSYEIKAIEANVKSQILQYQRKKKTSDSSETISIKPNKNTLKVEIKSSFEINFTASTSIGRLLGFSKRILEPGYLHESDLPVEITQVKTICVECNLVTGSYYQDRLQHTIFEFSPTVDPGYAINLFPSNVVYLPINTDTIRQISVRICDQDGNVVNFRGEKIVVRFELKKTPRH